jgi:hypothetical protein
MNTDVSNLSTDIFVTYLILALYPCAYIMIMHFKVLDALSFTELVTMLDILSLTRLDKIFK